jgi:hypothetical protein
MNMNKHADEIWLSWSEINQIQARRDLVFFGRGEWMGKSIPYLAKPAAYVVDNNRYEQGQEEAGLQIYSPERLKEENPDGIFVIITTTSFPDVDRQLRSYGLRPGVHYCISPSLKNFQVTSRVNQHRQTIHFTCSDQPDQGGGLYSYDIATREKKKLLEGLCHGIVQSDKQIFMVDDLVGIRVMNSELETTKILDMPAKSRPHGIAHCPNRNIVFVNFSGRDAIGMYKVDSGEFLGEISLSEKFQKTGVAQHHINDSCVYGDYLYVSMFSCSGNWKIGMYDGAILQFDIDSRKCLGPVATDLWMPHTPIVINGVLHYCDSMRGIVTDTTWRVMTQFNGFVRGITYDGTYFYIGQSAHRYLDRREGTTNNISLDTGIFLVDAVNKVSKFYSIPDLTDINSVVFLGNETSGTQ